MKTNILYTIIFLVVFSACTDKEIEQVSNYISKVEQPISKEQRSILDKLGQSYMPLAERENLNKMISRTSANTEYYLSAEEFAALDFTTIPYYMLDSEKFIKDPSPENLMNCIHPSDNRVLFCGKKNGNLVIFTEAKKLEGEWRQGIMIEGMDYFKERFSWLPARLSEADDNKFYVLNGVGSLFIICYYDREPRFFNFIGTNSYSKKEFAQIMLQQKNTTDSWRSYFNKMNSTSKRNTEHVKDSIE